MPGRNLTSATQTAESPAQSHPAHRTAPSPVGDGVGAANHPRQRQHIKRMVNSPQYLLPRYPLARTLPNRPPKRLPPPVGGHP